MIPVFKFDTDGECQHCHKSKLGAFLVEINNRRLDLCYKCLANQVGIFGEDSPKDQIRTFPTMSNGG